MSHLNIVFAGHVDAGKSTICGTQLTGSFNPTHDQFYNCMLL